MEIKNLKVGMKLRCISDESGCFTKDKNYKIERVTKYFKGVFYFLKGDNGYTYGVSTESNCSDYILKTFEVLD